MVGIEDDKNFFLDILGNTWYVYIKRNSMVMIKAFLTQKEVNNIFHHIPTRTIRWWGLMGFYGWAAEFPDGRGISRQYDLGSLYEIGIVEELSSLNIPSSIIKQIMTSHFRNSLTGFEIKKEQETDNLGNKVGPAKYTFCSSEMERVLVISKSPRESEPGKRKRRVYDWVSSVVFPYEPAHMDTLHTMILVNLEDIKKWVDSLVAQQ